MAVHLVSDLVEANPGANIQAPAARVRGKVRVAVGNFTGLTTYYDEAEDILLLASIPSGAIILDYFLGHTDAEGGGPTLLADYGFCNRMGGNVALSGTDSRERFRNAVDESGVVGAEQRFATLAGDTVAQRLFELAGRTSDPAEEWFICWRCSTAATTPNADTLWNYRIRYAVE